MSISKIKNKEKILFSAWHCPYDFYHFVCEKATQKDIDEHLKECELKPKISKIEEINKLFDEKFPRFEYMDVFACNAKPSNIKKFYTQQILSLIEELEGKKKL